MSRRRRAGPRAPVRTPAATPGARGALLWYGGVFLIAFAIRLAVAIGLSDLPLARTPELDSRQYLTWAGWIAEGNHAWPQPIIQGPAYAYVLAALLSASGGSLLAVSMLQGALGAAACVITAALGWRWFGRTAGLAAGLLQAVQGPLAFVETSIYCEGLLILLTLLSMYAFATRRSTSAGLVTAGLLLGAAAITRATALVILPVYLGMAALESSSPWRQRLQRAVLVAGGTVCLVLIVAWKNASDPSGSFQLQGFGGFNYYIGNSPAGSGTATVRLGAGWDQVWGEAWRAGAISPAAQDRYYVGKTLAEIGRDPAGFLRVLGAKAVWSFQSDEIRDSLSLHFFADAVPILRWLPGFGLLVTLAAAGALALMQRRSAPRELILWIVAAWASVVLLVVGMRYRLPLVPPLAILAGLGAASLVDAARAVRAAAPGWRALATLASAAIAAAFLSHLWRHGPSHSLSEEWAMTGSALNAERRLGDAEAAYRRAIALDDRSALAWKGLGVVLYNTKRLEEARDAHRRAIAIDPAFADAHLRLAFALGRLGRLDEALEHVRRAAAILPYDLAIRRALGQHLFATGDYGSAIRELEWVLARNPADGEIAAMLAEARRRHVPGPAVPRS
jgi:tetratricopeptide (TPR) repeat protein